jgi:two-component system, cell cycle response regulator
VSAADPFAGVLQGLSAVVVVAVEKDGRVRSANRGFRALLSAELQETELLTASAYFLSPTFRQLVALAASGEDPCYEGLMTLGDRNGESQTLRGKVYLREDHLLVVAEYDVEELLRVSHSAMALTSELSQSQRELIAMNRQLSEREAEIRRLSMIDSLTGLGNRRQLDDALAAEVSDANRHGKDLSLAMIDLDHFKQVNDVHGHAVGDSVLQALGRVLLAGARGTDRVCRFGGEEFAMIMRDTAVEAAAAAAERLRVRVETMRVAPLEQRLTASFGVAQWRPGETPGSLLQRADKLLYRAKAAGRNRIVHDG